MGSHSTGDGHPLFFFPWVGPGPIWNFQDQTVEVLFLLRVIFSRIKYWQYPPGWPLCLDYNINRELVLQLFHLYELYWSLKWLFLILCLCKVQTPWALARTLENYPIQSVSCILESILEWNEEPLISSCEAPCGLVGGLAVSPETRLLVPLITLISSWKSQINEELPRGSKQFYVPASYPFPLT